MTCTIYKITNLVNLKVYIGQTWKSDLHKYFSESHARVKGRVKLYNAIQKYGKSSFIIEPLCFVDSQELADVTEEKLIVEYDAISSGYNLRFGGSHGKHSEESKRKISAALKGRKRPLEVRRKISKSHMGKVVPQGTRDKMARAKVGKRVSPNTEFKRGHTKNRRFSPEEEGRIVATYHSLKSSYKAAAVFGCDPCTIRNIARRHKGV